ncbi:unnamed protein product [Darwinula stevensoni]|uniref:Contactin n=1 Tax=Darwinula stevensoni TaxID=69355 RepID=A0A7R8X0H0_9CRUS|nr:unnamed protein product [Darwinula stevensoni]CAG0881139.1 unnamed protein product [Darwinula stevensoni]
MKVLFIIVALALFGSSSGQLGRPTSPEILESIPCPPNWVTYDLSCYRFVRSPMKDREEARRHCQSFNAELVAVNTLEEHSFLVRQLRVIDPHHRPWYVGARQQSKDHWVNDADNTDYSNLRDAFLKEREYDREFISTRDYLTYNYSNTERRWGLQKVTGREREHFICEVHKAELRFVNLNDRTLDYGVLVSDPRYIPRGPRFVTEPMPQVFDLTMKTINNNVAITCLADGYPYPTYGWFKEAYEGNVLVEKEIKPLDDERVTISGGTLIINRPKQIDDRGEYFCKATNKFGTIRSTSVQVSFGYIAEFNLKRSDEFGQENWGKAIYCDPPQAYPDLSFYWSRDYFPNFIEEDRRTFVSNDGHMYISALERIDAGNYSCNVQTNVSATGKNGPFFSLHVLPHPNYQQLRFPNSFPKAFPETPIAGQDVRMECMAFGFPVPSYNWTRRYGDIPRKAQVFNHDRVLLLPKAEVEDEGEYVCTVSNTKLSIQGAVTLSIQAKPEFTVPLGNMHMDKGEDLTWTCEAFGVPEVKWLRDGVELKVEDLPPQDKQRYEITENVLTISKLDPRRDEGMYQCEAKNQLGNAYSSGQLRVLTLKPSFEKAPLEPEILALEGANVTIACDPEAAPRPDTFSWLKDGYSNIGASTGRRRILPNGHLNIEPVYLEDQGTYTCIAKNEFGDAKSSGRLVVVATPTMIRSPPQLVEAYIHQELVLPCEATNYDDNLEIAYAWAHNGLRIDFWKESDVYRLHQGNLILRNVTLDESGRYDCIIETAAGEVSSGGRLIVEGPPGPPGGIEVTETTAQSARIEWTDGADNGRPIRYYRIEGRTNWNSTWVLLVEDIQGIEVKERGNRLFQSGRKEAYIRDVLSPWSSYEFRVSAANSFGYGQPSEPSPQYNTDMDVPYVAPKNVGGGGGKIGDLTITWQPIPSQDQNAPGIFYKVYWRRIEFDNDSEWQNRELKGMGNIGMYVVAIPLKYFYTRHEVKVQGINSIGPGNTSAPVVIYSAEEMPQVAPTEVAARAYNSTSLNVTWLPIKETRDNIRGELIGYRIKYWREQDDERDALYYLRRSKLSWALIVGLQPNTYYYVRVMAYNLAGQGAESERYLERTYKLPPLKPPTAVHVFAIDPTSVRVTWRYVSTTTEEEPVQGYKILYWEVDQDFSEAKMVAKYLGGDLEAYIYDLSPGKRYLLRVLAFSQGGFGKMSSPAWEFQMGDPRQFSGAIYTMASLSTLVCCTLCLMIEFAFLR